jgi:hypothetical protein
MTFRGRLRVFNVRIGLCTLKPSPRLDGGGAASEKTRDDPIEKKECNASR